MYIVTRETKIKEFEIYDNQKLLEQIGTHYLCAFNTHK